MCSALCATSPRCLKIFKTTVQRDFDSCGIYKFGASCFFFFFLFFFFWQNLPTSVRAWISESRVRHLFWSTMPVQAPQWTEFLLCPICTQTFEESVRKPISLGCGHTVCKMCLNKLHRKACPFDQTTISTDIELLPVNTALLQLVCPQVSHLLLIALAVNTNQYKDDRIMINYTHLRNVNTHLDFIIKELWKIIKLSLLCVNVSKHL